jgi:hypothetical protein
MADQGTSMVGGRATLQRIDKSGAPVGAPVTKLLMVRSISTEEFNNDGIGLAPAPGEDNDAYARQYNTP